MTRMRSWRRHEARRQEYIQQEAIRQENGGKDVKDRRRRGKEARRQGGNAARDMDEKRGGHGLKVASKGDKDAIGKETKEGNIRTC